MDDKKRGQKKDMDERKYRRTLSLPELLIAAKNIDDQLSECFKQPDTAVGVWSPQAELDKPFNLL